MAIFRHIGKTANTDRRLVVVYMQIPGREDHALVVDTDSLPQKYHDDLMTVVAGEGQKEPTLAKILTRRIMPATGVDMLSTLHAANQLQAVPVGNVIMLPQPNHPVPLTQLIQHLNPSEPKTEATKEVIKQEAERENRILENQNIDKDDQQYQIAANILTEARMLEEEASRKREQAYAKYPALRPSSQAEQPVYSIDTNALTVETAKAFLIAQGFHAIETAPKPKRKSPTKKVIL